MENSTGKEAMERAYEKVIKEDFLCCIEEGNLSDKEAKALCQKKYPLDYVYQEWLKTDLSYMDVLRDSLDLASSKAVKEMKMSQRDSR